MIRPMLALALLATPALAGEFPRKWRCGESAVTLSKSGDAATINSASGKITLPSASAMSSHWAYNKNSSISECEDERASMPCVEAIGKGKLYALVLYLGIDEAQIIECRTEIE